MPNKKKTAPPESKRRVRIRRKGAEPAVDPVLAHAIAQAIGALELNALKDLVVNHEAQMHALRVILFDLLVIFREEHYNAKDVVSKKRFAEHIAKVRATLEQNVPEFRAHHGDQNDVDDLDANTDQELLLNHLHNVDVAALIRRAADDARDREEEPDEASDMMDEMLERASEEAEEWTNEARSPSPYDAGARRPHPRSRRPRR